MKSSKISCPDNGEEFVPAGGGLEEGLEIKRVQRDLAPEYKEAPKYSEQIVLFLFVLV